MEMIFDLVDPQELQGFVRDIQAERDLNQFRLSAFLPNRTLDDIEYRVTTGTLQDEDAALVRAWDAEAPIGSRQGVRRIMGELPPISKKIRLGEEESLRRRKLETGDQAPLVNAIYDDAAKMGRAVGARIELFRGEALQEGTITISENGVEQVIDFGRSSSHDAASNTLTGTNLWSDHDSSDPIENLGSWADTYEADNDGTRPAFAVVSRSVLNHLLRNSMIRTAAVGTGSTNVPNLVTPTVLAQVLGAYDLPALVVYETKLRVSGVQTRVLDADKVILLPAQGQPLGATLLGTTAEARELVGANQLAGEDAPGLVAVTMKTWDPVSTWTKAAAIALPTLVNPDLTFVAKVI